MSTRQVDHHGEGYPVPEGISVVKNMYQEFQQFREDMSCSPPIQTSISASRSKCQERGYSGYIPRATLWFYLSYHEEDMRI